jgi:hypothetical protein
VNVIGWIKRARAGREARRAYWELDAEFGTLHIMLGEESEPDLRARLLRRMSDTERRQAMIHNTAFGVDVFGPDTEEERVLDALGLFEPDAAGDMATSMLWSALLYRLIADVEQAVAYPKRGRRYQDHASADVMGTDAVNQVLDVMAGCTDLHERMGHLGALAEAAIGKAGGQAVEAVFCLPYPGKVASVTP